MTLRNEGTNVASSQKASAEGEYVFANVKPGLYQLTFDANGFQRIRWSIWRWK